MARGARYEHGTEKQQILIGTPALRLGFASAQTKAGQ
jgi:hypothetical protein